MLLKLACLSLAVKYDCFEKPTSSQQWLFSKLVVIYRFKCLFMSVRMLYFVSRYTYYSTLTLNLMYTSSIAGISTRLKHRKFANFLCRIYDKGKVLTSDQITFSLCAKMLYIESNKVIYQAISSFCQTYFSSIA